MSPGIKHHKLKGNTTEKNSPSGNDRVTCIYIYIYIWNSINIILFVLVKTELVCPVRSSTQHYWELWVHGLLFLLQHWENLVTNGPEEPWKRRCHAVTVIYSPLMGDQQTLLVMTGGYAYSEILKDCWLLSVGDSGLWREVSVVTGKWHTHSTCGHHHL